jgi:hypothetical protein
LVGLFHRSRDAGRGAATLPNFDPPDPNYLYVGCEPTDRFAARLKLAIFSPTGKESRPWAYLPAMIVATDENDDQVTTWTFSDYRLDRADITPADFVREDPPPGWRTVTVPLKRPAR